MASGQTSEKTWGAGARITAGNEAEISTSEKVRCGWCQSAKGAGGCRCSCPLLRWHCGQKLKPERSPFALFLLLLLGSCLCLPWAGPNGSHQARESGKRNEKNISPNPMKQNIDETAWRQDDT